MYQQNPAFANPAYVAQLQQQQQQQQGRQQNFQQHHHQNLQQQQNFQNLRDAQRSPVQGGYAQGNFGGSVFGMGQAQHHFSNYPQGALAAQQQSLPPGFRPGYGLQHPPGQDPSRESIEMLRQQFSSLPPAQQAQMLQQLQRRRELQQQQQVTTQLNNQAFAQRQQQMVRQQYQAMGNKSGEGMLASLQMQQQAMQNTQVMRQQQQGTPSPTANNPMVSPMARTGGMVMQPSYSRQVKPEEIRMTASSGNRTAPGASPTSNYIRASAGNSFAAQQLGPGFLMKAAGKDKRALLLATDDVVDILASHKIDVSDTEGVMGLAQTIQRAVHGVAKRIILDICAHKKKNINTVKHLSVAATDVEGAIKELGGMNLPQRVFYEFCATSQETLGLEDEATVRNRMELAAVRDNDTGVRVAQRKRKRVVGMMDTSGRAENQQRQQDTLQRRRVSLQYEPNTIHNAFASKRASVHENFCAI